MTLSSELTTIYEQYLSLTDLQEREFGEALPSKLFCIAGYDAEIHPLIFAGEIASAAILLIETENSAVLDCRRARACEFTVHSLSEAIRILKNQIRKQQPVSVLLTGQTDGIVQEMLERGLQPDLVASSRKFPHGDFSRPFAARGAVAIDPTSLLAAYAGRRPEGMLPVRWEAAEAPGRWLPMLDEVAANVVNDIARRHWIASAPSYLDRLLQFSRFVPMTNDEARMFFNTISERILAGEIEPSIHLSIGGESQPIARLGRE